MKVKVTKANKNNPDYWYNRYVGKMFEVISEDKHSYEVKPEYFTHEPGVVEYHIHKDDCEILKIKVKITKQTESINGSWINDYIGQIFEVEDNGEISYRVINNDKFKEYYIWKICCEIVKDIHEFEVGDRVRFLRMNIDKKDIDNWLFQPLNPPYRSKLSGIGKIIDIGNNFYVIEEDNGEVSLSRYAEHLKQTKYLVPEGVIIDGKIRIDKFTDESDIFFFYSKIFKNWVKATDNNLAKEKYYTGFKFKHYELVKVEIGEMKETKIYYDDDPENISELNNYENYGIKIGNKLYFYYDNGITGYDIIEENLNEDSLYEVIEI